MALINLHNHSTFSDGTLTPATLAGEAARAGIKYFSLTDHDSVGGWGEMEPALKEHGIQYCYGVEISAGNFEHTHILGYGINPADPQLRARLEEYRGMKVARIKKTLGLLAEVGIQIAFEDLPWRGSCPPDVHQIAKLIRERKLANSRSQAQKQYFVPGAPAHVERVGPTAQEAIQVVKAAGGKAVLAHPYTLGKALDLAVLKDAGLEGLEVFYPAHTEHHMREFLDLAKYFGLFVTAGTDFHGPGTERAWMQGSDSSISLFSEMLKLLFQAKA